MSKHIAGFNSLDMQLSYMAMSGIEYGPDGSINPWGLGSPFLSRAFNAFSGPSCLLLVSLQ